MTLLTPEGKPAGSIDRIMLLALWEKKLREEKHSTRPAMIAAGMGKPTFPISQFAVQSAINYWNQALSKTQEARHLLSGADSSDAGARNRIAKIFAAIDYGNPRGDFVARVKISQALTRWYGNKLEIEPQHVLFTVGGAGALSSIFTVINKRFPNSYILTPFPHYSLYVGSQRQNKLYPINVMQEKGYRLTAAILDRALKAAMQQAQQEGSRVSAILLCDPNNPLGTALDVEELQKIVAVLKQYPDLLIILDEAYSEMRWTGEQFLSLLRVAPELKDRIILMRSATKALSAAGERMAVTIAFNDDLMADLIQENVNVYGHAPRSLQFAFAEAMEKLDAIELNNLRNYYKPQVDYVTKRLLHMGAAMPDRHYQVEGAFYIVADFSDLLGEQIFPDAARALNKSGKVTTDEELIYSLLFDDGVMIAPLSYFGLSHRLGYVRITCSAGESELEELMNRLEKRLCIARHNKQIQFEQQLAVILKQLQEVSKSKAIELQQLATQALGYQVEQKEINALALKNSNQVLLRILRNAKLELSRYDSEMKHEAALKIQSLFRGYQGRKQKKDWQIEITERWRKCVNSYFDCQQERAALYRWTPSKRLSFLPWKEYLHNAYEKSSLTLEEKVTCSPSHLPRSKL